MQRIVKILKSQKGQSVVEILVGIVGVATIAFAISQALTPSVGDLHNKTVDGITSITGSGM